MLPSTHYTAERGCGFEPGANVTAIDRGGDALRGVFCTSDKPFLFSVALPEGNYNVTVTLGDPAGESVTTVKAECRRLMLDRVATNLGELQTQTFTVNIRNSSISTGGEVRLKEREIGICRWDDKLTLES